MISALAPNRPDQSFNISVLPGCAQRRGPVPDPHRSDASFEDAAKCAVIVANEISRCAVPGKRLGDLPPPPRRRRIPGHRDPQQAPPSVAKNNTCEELL